MFDFKTIEVAVENRIARLALNRPEVANGLNLEMATELARAAKWVASSADVKVVVLTARGRFFCAGGDVKAMHDASDPGITVKAIADQLHAALADFATMDAPLICAVNGTAAGAGFSMAVAGDLVLASQSAKFNMAYSNIGLSPDGSASYYLPRLIGLRKTQELMFTNRMLTADEALDWGLLNKVVADDALLAEANALAERFANGAKGSNAAIKRLLSASDKNSLSAQLEFESETISVRANSPDGKEGVAAFIEKREPKFD